MYCNVHFRTADILQTSDELSHVLERYEVLLRKTEQPIPQALPQRASLDLLDLGPVVQPQLSPRSTLDDQLLLGLEILSISKAKTFLPNFALFVPSQ